MWRPVGKGKGSHTGPASNYAPPAQRLSKLEAERANDALVTSQRQRNGSAAAAGVVVGGPPATDCPVVMVAAGVRACELEGGQLVSCQRRQ